MADPKPHKIALVDDDRAVRDSLRFLLELLGHTVEVFGSAANFLKSDLHDVACLILDHHMPQMTGLELAGRLHANGVAIPILLITGSPSPAIATRATELGIERVLEKPLSEHDLLSFIESI